MTVARLPAGPAQRDHRAFRRRLLPPGHVPGMATRHCTRSATAPSPRGRGPEPASQRGRPLPCGASRWRALWGAGGEGPRRRDARTEHHARRTDQEPRTMDREPTW